MSDGPITEWPDRRDDVVGGVDQVGAVSVALAHRVEPTAGVFDLISRDRTPMQSSTGLRVGSPSAGQALQRAPARLATADVATAGRRERAVLQAHPRRGSAPRPGTD